MISFLVLLLSYVTVVCFGLAKAKHHHQVFGTRPTILRQRILSIFAWVSLGLTFGVGRAVASEWLIGTALVAGGLTCAGLLNTMLLTYRPQAILPIFNRKAS